MNLLPIGTIVLLKEGTKKVMIFGRKQIDKDNNKVWDYIACLYPEGNISSELYFLFNKEDIEEVVFKGYEDEEDAKYQEVICAIEKEFINKQE